MKYRLFIICLTISIAAFSQKTKKVVAENEMPEYKEVFYVLVDSPAVRHGKYTRTFSGRYKNEEKGQYDHGKKTGVWTFTGFNGKVEQEIDFSNHKVISAKPFKMVVRSYILQGDRWVDNNAENLPLFLGGESRAINVFLNYMRYPGSARRLGIDGSVYVSGIITKDGKLVDEQIERSRTQALDEEAVRVIKLLPNEWLPVGWGTNPQESKVVLEIKYKLN